MASGPGGSGSYQYLGSTPAIFPAQGSGIAAVGRGPIDAFIIGGVTLSASLSSSDGTQDVEIVSVSGTIFQNSSSFLGNSYSILFGPTDVSKYPNLAITLVNNHATNKLESGSVEFSPNNIAWETDWNVSTFANLAANGGVRSMQITGNSRKWLRVRGIPSGSTGAFTGSIDVYVHGNNG